MDKLEKMQESLNKNLPEKKVKKIMAKSGKFKSQMK